MSRVLTDNKYYSQIADVIREQNGTSNTYTPPQMVNALKDLFYEEVEGVPPISFNGIGENLLDYRIDGASGGVGDRTENLFFKKIENANIASNDGRIYSTESFDLWIGKVKAGETYTSYNTNAIVGFFTDEPDYGAYTYDNSRITNATSVFTFTVPNGCSYVGVRILKNEPTAMLNSGSTALPYEPYGYKVPVVVSGKNLLSKLPDSRIDKGIEYTNVNNLYLHIEGTSNAVYSQTTSVSLLFKKGKYYINFYCDEQYKSKLFVLLRNNNNIDIVNVHSSGASFELNNDETIKLIAGVKENNTTINTNMYIQIVSGITSQSTYEPYIEPTTTNIYLDEPIEAKANIPSEYEEVEYIESTGTQYIDTNYTPVQGDDLEFKNVTINTFNGALFSAGTESYQLILLGLGSVCYYKYFQTGNAAASSFSTITNGNIKVLNGNLYINNILKVEANYGGAVNTTLNIFQRANNTSNLIGKI